MKRLSTILMMSILSMILINACTKKEQLTQEIEKELITKVGLRFSNGTETITVEAEDKDGEGGLPMTIGSFTLTANSSYTLEVVPIEDTSKSPTVNLLDEIIKKQDKHLFFYDTGKESFKISNRNLDNNQKPFGTKASAQTGTSVIQGTLTVTLIHVPSNKSAETLKDIGGSSDISIAFPYAIK